MLQGQVRLPSLESLVASAVLFFHLLQLAVSLGGKYDLVLVEMGHVDFVLSSTLFYNSHTFDSLVCGSDNRQSVSSSYSKVLFLLVAW